VNPGPRANATESLSAARSELTDQPVLIQRFMRAVYRSAWLFFSGIVSEKHPTDFGAFAGTIFVSFVPLIIMLIFQRYFTSSIAVSDNVGHNHPFVVAELVSELQSQSPTMLQSNVVMEAGALARTLCENAGGKVSKVFFCSSGSEGVEAVIKFARAHTGRTDLVYAAGAFHGLTSGALSLTGSDFWRESFGPMLGGTHEVLFGDLVAIESCS
jgi:hypothetical protein